MDETRNADEIRRLLEAAEASEKPWDWEYGLEQARLDIHYLLAALDAAEQRAAEAEGLLRTVEDKLVPMMNFLGDNKLEYSVYWRDASPDDGAYVKCKVAEWQNLEETFQAAAKWLEEHGG